MQVTNLDPNGVVLRDGVWDDGVLNVTGAASLAAGTLIARNTSTGKLGLYASGGTSGLDTPIAVLTYAKEISAAGDYAVRVLRGGVVNKGKLIEHGVGAVSDLVVDTLVANSGVVAVDVQDLGGYDNQ